MPPARHDDQPWDHAAPRGTRSKALTPATKAAAKRRAKAAGRPYPNLVDNMQAAKQQKAAAKGKAGAGSGTGNASKAKPGSKTAAAPKGKAASPTRAATKTGAAAKKTGAAAKKTDAAAKKTAGAAQNTKAAAKKTSAASKPRAPAKTGAASKTRSAAKRTAKSAGGAMHKSKASAAKSPGRDPKGGLTAAGRAEFRRRDGAHLKPGVKKQRIADMTPEELRRKGSWATRFFGRDPLPPLRDAQGKPTRFALSAHAWGEPVPGTEAAARRIADKGRRLLERYRRLRDA